MSFTIKTVSGNKIYDPFEIVGNFGIIKQQSFIVENSSLDVQENCYIFFEKTENLGDVDNPGTLEPYIDFEHFIMWGNQKIEDPNRIGFLSVIYNGEEKILSRNICDSKKNGFNIGRFEANESKEITIQVEVPSSLSSRRLFINLVAE